MNPSTIQQIVQAVTPLAHKIGQGGEQLFRIYTKQQFIIGITDLIWAVFVIVGAVVFMKLALACYRQAMVITKARKAAYYNNEEIKFQFGTIFLGISAAVCVIISPFLVTSGIQHLLNPQYYTIQEIICTVKDCGAAK